jgi:translation initiation factor IF-2
MRVYELAKQLSMESRILIPELIKLGIEVTSHSNALDEADAERAILVLKGKNTESPVSSGGTKKSSLVKGTKTKGGGKGVGRTSGALGVEEPPKPEKKQILFKRKKEQEDVPPLEASIPAEAAGQGDLSPLTLESSPEGDSDSLTDLESTENPEIAAIAPEMEVAPSPGAEVVGMVREEKSDGSPRTRTESRESESPSKKPIEEEKPSKKTRKAGKPKNEDLMAARYEDAARWQDLRPLPTLRREERTRHVPTSSSSEITKPRKKTIKLSPGISVKEFSELISQRSGDVIRKLMEVGLPLTLNQPMNLDAGALIAEGFGVHVEISAEKEGEDLLQEMLEPVGEETWESRGPVVTIMGHVDHGKTSLLDAIRKTKVSERESGGITQHIGAYTVKINEKPITFLDTPGHEAFTAMRARGAQVTDIVVLVVAADDGVMPQTIEAANHAQAANVPIIVAVNKMDAPGANPDRVKQGLSDQGLIPESWGGQTIFVEVSAKQGTGLDTLLEMILLQAEVMELKAEVSQSAKGIVLEAKLDRGRGPVATVLVQQGVLKVGATFVVGVVSGKVRAMVSYDGQNLKEAHPSTPVEVVGLLGMPSAGDMLVVVKDDRVAREIAEDRKHKQRTAELGGTGTRMTLDDLYAQTQEVEGKELAVVLKADVNGSVGALCEAIEKISSTKVKLRVIHSGVGGINESDVLLASASGAVIIGFHVRPEPKASALAEQEGVDIRLYTVIYNVIADIKAAAEGLLEPTLTERVLGRAEVREVFNIPKIGAIAGCYVNDGQIARASEGIRVLRDSVVVYEGKVGSLRRFKDDVREVQQGYECGISIENFNDLKVGDILEAYVFDKEATKL